MIENKEALVIYALAELVQANVPTDIQELLLRGNPEMNVAPGALRKALTAALSQLSQGWHSMESAPKDGRQLLLYIPGREDDPCQCGMWIWKSDDNSDPSIGTWWHADGREQDQPTHWMPIKPTSPASGREGGDGL